MKSKLIHLEARHGDLSFFFIEELGDEEEAGVLHGGEGTVQVGEVVMLQGSSASSHWSLPHHEGLEVVRAVGEVLQDMSRLQAHSLLRGLQQLSSVVLQGLSTGHLNNKINVSNNQYFKSSHRS